MALLDIFGVAGSAMSAQTVRLNVTASNLANAQSASSSVGGTYRARHPVFAAVHASALASADLIPDDRDTMSPKGVRVLGVIQSKAPLDMRYEPGHPLADKNGYVAYPNVNVVEEMANMISASRGFQVNVQIMQSARDMAERLLSLGQ